MTENAASIRWECGHTESHLRHTQFRFQAGRVSSDAPIPDLLDLRFCELCWTQLRAAFLDRAQPPWLDDPSALR